MKSRSLLAFACLLWIGVAAHAEERPALPSGAEYFGASSYSVYKIADAIYAIGEPTYYQANFSYLFVGRDGALILDGGASRDTNMRAVVASLTDKPVWVLPSHLHFDHLGGVEAFENAMLVDLPFTRGLADASGVTTIPVEVDLHDLDKLQPTRFEVKRYVAPDETIDLGGMKLKLVWTGGHTKDEIALLDASENLLFTGDFLYPSINFVGNVDDLVASADRLLGMIDESTRVFGAHGDPATNALPEMTRQDVLDFRNTFAAVQQGTANFKEVGANEWLRSAKEIDVNRKFNAWFDIVFKNGVALNYRQDR